MSNNALPPSNDAVDEVDEALEDKGMWSESWDELKQLVMAAPTGAVVFVAGIVFAIWSNVHISNLAEAADTNDAASVLDALRIVCTVLWVCVMMWGRQIMVVARNREETRRRLEYQGLIMDTIEESLRSRLVIKDEEVAKSRNFWDRLRNDSKL